MTDPLSLIPSTALTSTSKHRFVPKLDFPQRCAILALLRHGVDRRIVSLALDVNRRTVGHVSNPAGSKYREVRKELSRLGEEEFIKTYITEDIALRVAKAAESPAATLSDSQLQEAEGVPRISAKRWAGIQIVKPEQCAYTHRLEIKFLTDHGADLITGWHFRDLDSKSNPTDWFHSGHSSLMTSQACLEEAKANLTDD